MRGFDCDVAGLRSFQKDDRSLKIAIDRAGEPAAFDGSALLANVKLARDLPSAVARQREICGGRRVRERMGYDECRPIVRGRPYDALPAGRAAPALAALAEVPGHAVLDDRRRLAVER